MSFKFVAKEIEDKQNCQKSSQMREDEKAVDPEVARRTWQALNMI